MTYRHIADIVAREHGVTIADLRGSCRRRVFAIPRFEAMAICREFMVSESLTDIGRYFNRDHTMVLYAMKRAKAAERDDPEFARRMAIYREECAPAKAQFYRNGDFTPVFRTVRTTTHTATHLRPTAPAKAARGAGQTEGTRQQAG